MCLHNVYSKEKQQRILDKLPNVIEVYKTVNYHNGGYRALFRNFRFLTGSNKAKGTTRDVDFGRYRAGFHSFKSLHGAKRWGWYRKVIVKCKIKKAWITAVGCQGDSVVFVTNKIIMPSPRTKDKIVAGKRNVRS